MSLEIMHIDMDAFYAAVEQLDNPQLRGKPVIVGGVKLSKRGVVATASYEARSYGVHSAMPIAEARKLCPEGIFLPGRHERYAEISRQIFEIFYHYTPLVEKVSIDEAFLDLTGCHRLFGSSEEIGWQIKREIKQQIGLTASVGLASNKFLAKLASDMDKPDGFFIIPEDKIQEILDPLPVRKIWGVGPRTAEILQQRGIYHIKTLRLLSKEELIAIFGKIGEQLYYLARGIDQRRVNTQNQLKSISHEETFAEFLTEEAELYRRLLQMADKVGRRMRRQGVKANTVFVKVRYSDFTTLSRQITLKGAIAATDEIYQTGLRLIKKYKLLTQPVRLLGIGVDNLSQAGGTQLSLFQDLIKEDKLTKTIDELKDRFGDDCLSRARNLKS